MNGARQQRVPWFAVSALAAAFAVACAGVEPSEGASSAESVSVASAAGAKDFETLLQQGFEANTQGDFFHAAYFADQVLAAADATEPIGAYARFRAAMQGAEAHWRASAGFPYLREPDAAGVRQLSEVAHLIAMTDYLAAARRCARVAALADDQDSVPSALQHADLMELVAHERLGLRASVNAYLKRATHLHDALRCAEIARNAPLAGRRPWIYSALFDFQRNVDELQAYRFAVMCIDEAPSAGARFDAQRVRELEEWIVKGASLEFHCPKCGLLVNPGLRACANDRTPNVEFVGRKRL